MIAGIFKGVLAGLIKDLLKDAAKRTPSFVQSLKSWWYGKTIAIIGPTASGKNSMFSRIKKEQPPVEYIQTRGADEVGDFKFSWRLGDGSPVEFNCKKSINVGGEHDERDRVWAQACAGADVIFYLVDIKQLKEEPSSTLDRIRGDFRWMAEKFRDFKAGVVVQILMNKVDELDFTGSLEDQRQHILDVLKDESDRIHDIARKILGARSASIVGISPISMIDDYLFDVFFVDVLSTVFSKVNQK
ncbi:hypothetical protein KXR94_06390 [Stutzerimonas stutzeri]